MTDYNNLLIAESEGASPDEHVSHIAALRREAERYQWLRRIACLPDDKNDIAIALMAQLDDFPDTEDGYDAWVDACMREIRP